MRTTWVAFGAAAVLGFVLACVVDLPPDGKYTCTSDSDCGSGYKCTPATAGPRFCCQQGGAEVCDGKDNDCNGVVDDIPTNSCYSGLPPSTLGQGLCHGGTEACANGVKICAGEVVPTTEICNSADDDCDGVKDDGFDFINDPTNCGRCGVGCVNGQRCEDGGCAFPIETICNDTLDNDGDQVADCADSDCASKECSLDGGCTCRNFGKVETGCGDTFDNDNDGPVDCLDNDCDGGSCGTGCRCQRGGKVEILCNDGNDNDNDSNRDCADVPDCNGQPCGDGGCTCAGGQATETNCQDTSDNDGDSLLNCADPDCNSQLCGSGCSCAGGTKHETACNDIADNDNDGNPDCADVVDCNGASCGTGCMCGDAGTKTETNCTNGGPDEDGDMLFNCADPDCNGKTCRTSPMRTCVAGTCQ